MPLGTTSSPHSDVERRDVHDGHAEGDAGQLVFRPRQDLAQRLARARVGRDYVLVDAAVIAPVLKIRVLKSERGSEWLVLHLPFIPSGTLYSLLVL